MDGKEWNQCSLLLEINSLPAAPPGRCFIQYLLAPIIMVHRSTTCLLLSEGNSAFSSFWVWEKTQTNLWFSVIAVIKQISCLNCSSNLEERWSPIWLGDSQKSSSIQHRIAGPCLCGMNLAYPVSSVFLFFYPTFIQLFSLWYCKWNLLINLLYFIILTISFFFICMSGLNKIFYL